MAVVETNKVTKVLIGEWDYKLRGCIMGAMKRRGIRLIKAGI
jgi:hypothetical protein